MLNGMQPAQITNAKKQLIARDALAEIFLLSIELEQLLG